MTFTELKNALVGKDVLEIFNAFGKVLEDIVEKVSIRETDNIDYLVKSIKIQKQIYELSEKIYEELQENIESEVIRKQCDELEKNVNLLLNMKEDDQ